MCMPKLYKKIVSKVTKTTKFKNRSCDACNNNNHSNYVSKTTYDNNPTTTTTTINNAEEKEKREIKFYFCNTRKYNHAS